MGQYALILKLIIKLGTHSSLIKSRLQFSELCAKNESINRTERPVGEFLNGFSFITAGSNPLEDGLKHDIH